MSLLIALLWWFGSGFVLCAIGVFSNRKTDYLDVQDDVGFALWIIFSIAAPPLGLLWMFIAALWYWRH